MASRRLLLRRQRGWARRAGLTVDAAGYLPTIDANLREPLSPSAQADFTARGGGEFLDAPLAEGGRHAARLRAVQSSTALAVNVFDYWNSRDPAPLARALDLKAPIRRLSFEPQLPTALGANPANPDLFLALQSGDVVAIECKFSEWLLPKRQRHDVFHERYFPEGPGVWRAAGLAACQGLAEDLQCGREYFRYLDVRQLLKHALGLATGWPSAWSMIYLFFDWPGQRAALHRAEFARLVQRTGAEIDLRALTYQAMTATLADSTSTEYQAYLARRYRLGNTLAD